MTKAIVKCSECESDYYQASSLMMSLCPECSHYLYDYENCPHKFVDGRCVNCYWNGDKSDYFKGAKCS